MKNIDKIRQMNSEELAKWLSSYTIEYETCTYCPIYHFCRDINKDKVINCIKTHRQWLEQEVDE
mgnify:CR=1 FL=1